MHLHSTCIAFAMHYTCNLEKYQKLLGNLPKTFTFFSKNAFKNNLLTY